MPNDFRPRRFLRNPHLQTLVAALLPRRNRLPPAEERRIAVEPGVRVLCRCHWQPERAEALTVVLVHGLEGSDRSQYIIGTANKAFAAGMNVVRMNMRNCGGSERLGPTLYHSGLSGDVGAVVRTLIAEERLARMAVAGFSMGGQLVLKLAGEWGRDNSAPPELRAVAAVCPSMDIAPSVDALHQPANRLYEWNFVWSLKGSVRRKARLFPGRYDLRRLGGVRTLRDFDDRVTAFYCGFQGADDYYQRAAAANLVEHIRVPTLLVHALDDPFVRITPPVRAKLLANPHITMVETEHGGHCGFLAAADRAGYDGRWAERTIVEFLRGATD